MNRFSKGLSFLGVAVASGFWGYSLHPTSPIKSPDAPTLSELAIHSGDRFPLPRVIEETTGYRVIPLDDQREGHAEMISAIVTTSETIGINFSKTHSEAHSKGRINEVSVLFENALQKQLDELPEISCSFPRTKEGKIQRSGYPDLRVEHLPTGTVAYLDPKVFDESSLRSTFRSFYHEPSLDHSKVTEDALHLLVGFPHDGKTSSWTFGSPTLVDLSNITLKFKAEFSASNKDLYAEPGEP